MKSFRFVVLGFLFGLLLLLLGCGPKTSTVSGSAVLSSSGAPVAGATVRIGGLVSKTTSSGEFIVQGVEEGVTGGELIPIGFPAQRFTVDSETSVTLTIPESQLTLHVEENAVERRALKGGELTLDGRTTTSTAVSGLSPGDHSIGFKASGHETYETTLTLKPGSNEATLNVSLTALATYKRFYEAGRFHRVSTEYKYIHPDERKKLSLKALKKWGAGTEDKSVKFGRSRKLRKWKSKVTGRTYRNVVGIDRTATYQVTDSKYSDFGKTYTNNYTQYWVKHDGRWYIIHREIP